MAVARGPSLLQTSAAIAAAEIAGNAERERREDDARRRREADLAAIRAQRLDFDGFGHRTINPRP
jgi:hypothetical protein